MPLVLSIASESESSSIAERIADIHRKAFRDNILLRAQFPTQAARIGLHETFIETTIAEIHSPWTNVLVIRDTDLKIDDSDQFGKIIAFAKWDGPIAAAEGDKVYDPLESQWPEGTDMEILTGWAERMRRAKDNVLGQEWHYHLIFLATDPDHGRRGAATMLVKWGIEQATKHGIPAYLESTADAELLYNRQGFESVGQISTVLGLKEGAGDGGLQSYRETCCIFRPKVAS